LETVGRDKANSEALHTAMTHGQPNPTLIIDVYDEVVSASSPKCFFKLKVLFLGQIRV
jgi:hypothetical protein